MLPTPDNFDTDGVITNWTKGVADAAILAQNNGAVLMCDVSDIMDDICLGRAFITDSGEITVNTASTFPNDGGIYIDSFYFTAQYNTATGNYVITNTLRAAQTVNDTIVVLNTGKNMAFNEAPNTYTSTQFNSAFGFNFTDLLTAIESPLLLKTMVKGVKCAMTAMVCENGGNTQSIEFLHGTTIYYAKSTDGGVTIKTGLYTLQTTTN